MRKGIYTATVALVALVLATSMIAISTQTQALTIEGNYSNSALEVKREWQNTWSLFDKAASDALADNIANNNCVYDEISITAEIGSYFDSILNRFDNCSMGTISLTSAGAGTGDDVTITVNDLECHRQFGEEFEVEYSKNVAFVKNIVFVGTSPTCNITITDVQSGLVEVNETV
jgi:hypothetical protein